MSAVDKSHFKVLSEKKMAFGFGEDPHGIVRIISGGLVGAAGSLAMWFNDILNGDAVFSFGNFFMLVFIGVLIGVMAIIIAPMFHIDENYVTVFACSAAAAHKYIFRSASWLMEKWVSSERK